MERLIDSLRGVIYVNKDDAEYIQFANFKKHDSILTHCFSTRLGGVSTGECYSLNFGFNRKDSRKNVLENYNRICNSLDIKIENLVFSNQVHGIKIWKATEADRGKGIFKESDIKGYDGLVTDRREVALVTFYADCVPVFFLDPIRRVAGMVHSGWRGTVSRISAEMVSLMASEYNCKRSDILVSVGPSIGECCFEVGEEVYTEFIDRLPLSSSFCIKKPEGKWFINLQGIIKRTLEDEGINKDNIYVSGICTKCNKDMFFSHRGDNGKTGSLAGFMQLR